MYVAELHGKLPSRVFDHEDVLTSHVFSFLDYSDRLVYLRRFLAAQPFGLRLEDHDLEVAEFAYWPCLDDTTEADAAIAVGGWYLLFEAKLGAPIDDEQLSREIRFGKEAAARAGARFRLTLVTAHACQPPEITRARRRRGGDSLLWTNWQSVAMLLLATLEEREPPVPNRRFARDLLAILERRQLRPFRGFSASSGAPVPARRREVFLTPDRVEFRGAFAGFDTALRRVPRLEPEGRRHRVFFGRSFFSGLSEPDFGQPSGTIFLRRTKP